MGFVLVLTFNCSSVPACHHRLLRLAKVPNNCVQMGHASENVFSMFNSNGPLKSCSVECSGKLIKDGRCGSDDVSIESIFNQMTRY